MGKGNWQAHKILSKEVAEIKYAKLLKNCGGNKFKAYKKYLHSNNWYNKRLKKLKESEDKCLECSVVENLEVHHIVYKSYYDCNMDDLEVLCQGCHAALHFMHRTDSVE
ncbi:MAG: hypothetical protein QQN63_12240 [Nitrosopumilus sp.]